MDQRLPPSVHFLYGEPYPEPPRKRLAKLWIVAAITGVMAVLALIATAHAQALDITTGQSTTATAGECFMSNATGAPTFQACPGGSSGVSSFNGRTGAVAPQTGDYGFANLSGSIAPSQLPASGVTAGSYTNSNITVDSTGRVTAASNGSGGGGSGLPAGFVVPNVVADGQFLTDGAMTSGSPTLTSASGLFVAGDVGKTINCGGPGTSGGVLSTTITGYTSASQVTLGADAATTATGAVCQWGTDNTAAINAEHAALVHGGTILLPTGYILVGDLNFTNLDSVTIEGASCGVNAAGSGTVLVPDVEDDGHPTIDLTGTAKPYLRCLQIGTTRSPVVGSAAVLMANSTTAATTLLKMDDVFVTSEWGYGALYLWGIQDSVIRDSQIWNYNESLYGVGSSQIGVYLTRDNNYGIGSAFASFPSGSQACGNVTLSNDEVHDFKPGGGATSGVALYDRGCSEVKLYGGLYDSSSNAVGVVGFTTANDGTYPADFMSLGSTFYDENGTPATYCLNYSTGTPPSGITMVMPSYQCSNVQN